MPRPVPTGALLLTAGLGTRLRPLTRDRAKPALPVAGRSLVERLVDRLREAGVVEILLNLHYCPDTITAIVGDGAALGVRARYSWEVPLLGSGGGPRRAFALATDDRLWLINGDTLSDVDLAAMAAEHAAGDALVTMALIPNPAPDRYGGVVVGDDGAIEAFVPRGAAGPTWHFIGVQIAERQAFAALADGVRAHSVGPLYRDLIAARRGSLRAFRSDARFLDIGTPRDYLEACLSLAAAPLVRGARFEAHPSARLTDCVAWDDVHVGRDVRLHAAILGDGVDVPEGLHADRVVILRGDAGLEVTPLV